MTRHFCFLLLAFTACGSVDTGSPDVDHTSPDGGTNTEPVPGVAPAVVAVDPPSGSVVDEGVSITITFSEPMDAAAVEGAISFPSAAAPVFEWNEDGNEMTASGLIPYPEGYDPNTVAARSFEVALGAGATDTDGDALDGGALALDYTLKYRRITQVFDFSQTLSGNCDAVCAGNYTWLAAGERSSDPTVTTRGFLTIPFNLPEGILVEEAGLHSVIEGITDNPFSFGDLMVDHVIFDAISGPAFSARGSAIGVLYARDDMPEVGDPASIDVTDRFADDYEHRATRGNRTQYRLHFPHDLAGDPAYTAYHSDGAWDILQLLRDGTQLSVTYLIE